uniref:Uncharacterized protein n=1 Tax=Octopus bimaculoides TaxID=37653 RepID=A0A0L8H2P0_OCTBM
METKIKWPCVEFTASPRNSKLANFKNSWVLIIPNFWRVNKRFSTVCIDTRVCVSCHFYVSYESV